ncbi:hypothetical protein AMTR_s00062p00133370 [Amborella trichopoda]|uniref:Uncharacterized protein n=1 Tax=Amborella trichopoda TaxID=13333 RepID=U5DBP1_AMBTC|nr:hypothetical protein AMTR_s00062p00133370 [Amborella trichopoda]
MTHLKRPLILDCSTRDEEEMNPLPPLWPMLLVPYLDMDGQPFHLSVQEVQCTPTRHHPIPSL